jgi:N-acetylmuramoyl-L-alanine amidase
MHPVWETSCLLRLDTHNGAVFKPAQLTVAALVLLAGCTTTPPHRERTGPPGDWGTTTPATNAPTPAPAKAPAQIAPVLPTQPVPVWIPLATWAAEHGLPAPVRLGKLPAVSYSVPCSNGLYVFEAATRTARMDGFEYWLGFAPRLMDGEFCLHYLDYRKNIEPLLTPPIVMAKTNRIVVLDPGHGGGNTGTQSAADGHYEKEFTLDWALRLAPLLRQRGWQVFLTRTNDAELTLGDRVAFAASHNADLFISLHFNAVIAGNHQAGVETYCLTPVGMPSTLTREFDDDPEASYPNNQFDIENFEYAVLLHRALLSVNGNTDRGVRRARFMGVLRGQERPAVLLEAGYLSNPAEARRIADPEYRQKLAEAVAGALQ